MAKKQKTRARESIEDLDHVLKEAHEAVLDVFEILSSREADSEIENAQFLAGQADVALSILGVIAEEVGE